MTIYTDKDGWFAQPATGIALPPDLTECPTCGADARFLHFDQRADDGRVRVVVDACGHPWVNERPLRLVGPAK